MAGKRAQIEVNGVNTSLQEKKDKSCPAPAFAGWQAAEPSTTLAWTETAVVRFRRSALPPAE